MPRSSFDNRAPREECSAINSLTADGLRGFLVGLLFAVIEYVLSEKGAHSPEAPAALVRALPLLFLPGLGFYLGCAGRIPLILVAAGSGLLYLIGIVAAEGGTARTLPLSAWWCWLMPLAFAAFWFAARRVRKSRFFVACGVPAALVLFAAASTLGDGHYNQLRQVTALFALVLAVQVAVGPDKKPRRGGLLIGLLSLLLVAGSIGTVAAYDSAARWCSTNGTLSALFTRAVRISLPAEDKALDQSLGHQPYFGTPLHTRCHDRLKSEFGTPGGVLVISVDAMRGDLLGRTIKGLPLTPELDRLGKEGFVMERAYSPAAISHWTLFSAFSGLLPGQITRHPQGLDGVPLITERLRDSGVVTRCSYDAVIHNARSRRQRFTRPEFGFENAGVYTSPQTVDEMIGDILPAAADERWFSFIHLMTPHAPYDSAPAELVTGPSAFENYCGEIRLADGQVKRVLDRFRAAGALADTWVIITSDHGENFGEHGEFFHGSNLYEESIHVPLIILPPNGQSARLRDCVSLTDLAPTLEDLFGLPPVGRPHYAGRSWLPLIIDGSDPGRADRAVAEIPPMFLNHSGNKVAITSQHHKLIVDRAQRLSWLYDLRNDPGELTDIADSSPGIVQQLRAQLDAAGARPEDPDEYGKVLELLLACETRTPAESKRLLLSLVESNPPAAASVAGWLATSEPTIEEAALSEALMRSSDPDLQQAAEMLHIRNNWNEVNFRVWFEATDHPSLLMGGYAMAASHGIGDLRHDPQTMPAANLEVELVRARCALHNKKSSRPGFDVVQNLVERALNTRNPFIRRLGFELIRESRHEGSAPHLLRAERTADLVIERVAILKALSAFDDKEISRRFLERSTDPAPEIREVVIRAWLNGLHLPETGIEQSSEHPARSLPTTLALTPSEQPRTLFVKLDNPGSIGGALRASCGTAWTEYALSRSQSTTIFCAVAVPAGTRTVSLEFAGNPPREIRLHAWVLAPRDG